MKIYIRDHADPSVGLFSQQYEIECPFEFDSSSKEERDFFKKEIINLYSEFSDGKITCEEIIKDRKIELGQFVYHEEIYNGNEQMEIVGIRKDEIELKGDYSGGTHKITQTSWMPIKGILFELPCLHEESENGCCSECGKFLNT